MPADEGLRPWPRVREMWWVLALGVAALGLFVLGFLVDLRCGYRGCRGSVALRLLDLDAVGSLPRLFTTALFAGVAVLAWRAHRAAGGRAAVWWGGVALIAAGLAVAKLLSLHSVLKGGSPVLTLAGGVLVTAVVLTVLAATGRRWGVAATGPVVAVLAVYAGAALGLDLLTGLAAAAQERVGWLTVAGTTFVEELGEALTAVLILVTVRWQAAGSTTSAQALRRAR